MTAFLNTQKPAILLALALCISSVLSAATPGQMLSNPTFTSTSPDNLPDSWSLWQPIWKNAAITAQSTPEGLLFKSASNPYAVGGLTQQILNIKPTQTYRIHALCRIHDIPSPYHAALIRVTWMHDRKELHPAGVLVRGPVFTDDGLARFDDSLTAPDNADSAVLSVEVKWPHGGSVLFKNVTMSEAPPPKPRNVKVGTVYLRPRQSTPDNNLTLFCNQIDEAGRKHLDIVCLGEAITSVGTTADLNDCAQPIPGPYTDRLAQAAKRNRIWVVAGLIERADDIVYNTAVLFDRTGSIAGKYRKVHLPREEWRKGITPGLDYPVFHTDFGTIAIQICYDWFFPEPETVFALHGAEIIFAPTWGNTLPDTDGRVDGETTFRVRARDNGVYMVPSVYDGDSLIIDPMGRILASSEGRETLVTATIDLNKREPLDWVGHWRSIAPRHRMTNTYLPLTEDLPKLKD
jgi:predicted amidohydrolase